MNTSTYKNKYNNSSTGIFKDNTTGDISAEDARTLVTDTGDNFLNFDDDVLDEDDFASNSATQVPTQQSVKAYVDAAALGIVTSWKAPVAVATTANITLSGEQTIDGVLTSASRILVKNQTAQSENGIYVTAAGAWARSSDANAAAELEGAAVTVQQGTSNEDTTWIQTTDGITLGSSNIVWSALGVTPVASAVAFTPAGNIAATDVQAAIEEVDTLKLNRNLTIKTKTTDHTLDAADLADLNLGKDLLFLMDVVSANNFTIPPNATVDVDAGGHLYVMRIGAGQTTVVQGAGVTVTGSANNLLDPGQYVMMPIIQTADNTWYLQNGNAGAYVAWTPGFTGFSVNPTNVDATYYTNGKFGHVLISMTPGTSNATSMSITGCPIAPRRALNAVNLINNGGATVAGRIDMAAGGTTINIYTEGGSGLSSTGSKAAYINLTFEVQ